MEGRRGTAVRIGWLPSGLIAALFLAHCGDEVGVRPATPSSSELAIACERVRACVPSASIASVGRCLLASEGLPGVHAGTNLLELDAVVAPLACIKAAADCAAVDACVTGRSGSCAPSEAPRCDGSRTIRCGSDDAKYVVDCSTRYSSFHDPGATCITTTDGRHACGFGACAAGTAARCDGDVLISCEDGIIRRKTCARCETTPSPHCALDGPSCDGPNRCENDDLVVCEDGREGRRACANASIPGTCGSRRRFDGLPGAPYPADELGCVPAVSLACDPALYRDRCEGETVRFCDGTERTLDCRAMNFAGCVDGRCAHR